MSADGKRQDDGNGGEMSSSLLTVLPLWFIAIGALIYATGFLSMLTFHESYNLRGLEAGFFKIKYAHVGLMFMAIPLIIGIALFAVCHYSLRTREARQADVRLDPFKGPPHPLVICLLTINALTFYLFVLFGPPGTFRDVHWYLGLTIVVAVAGRLVAERFADEEHALQLRMVRVACVALQAILLLRVTWGFKKNLIEMFIPAGLWYLALSLFMGWFVWVVVEKMGGPSANRDTMVWRCIAMILLSLVYYLAILSFGLGVYHYIPAGKGGGDFTTASFVVLRLKLEVDSKLPTWLSADQPSPELKLELLESGSASVFVANPWKKMPGKSPEESGPRIWRRARKYRPTVLEISRDQILSIEYLDESYESWLESRGKAGPGG